MMQFKQLSQCNYSYCYGFDILETCEMARYLCRSIKNVTNRSAMKCCSTVSKSKHCRSLRHIPQFRTYNSKTNHVLLSFIGFCCLRRLGISIASLSPEKFYAAEPFI